MAKIISQETFDDVVRENVVEFEMNIRDAKDETVKQFEAQGINLANIIKDLEINEKTGKPVLNETIDQLKEISAASNITSSDLPSLLETLSKECDASVPHRVMAAELGAYDTVGEILRLAIDKSGTVDSSVIKHALTAFNSLIVKNPDIFSDKAMFVCLQTINKRMDNQFISLVLQHLRHASLLHEINRQNIMNTGTVTILKPLLKTTDMEVLKETCALFRHLILDDDVRIEFSKAHEHARELAEEVLLELTKLLPVHMEDKNIFADLLITIAVLAVRQEFCVQVEDAGGLIFINHIMKKHSASIRISKESFKVLRALAGNDAVKKNILKNNMAELINEIINMHKINELFARAALHCLSTITLRSKENSQELFDIGIAETIVETMRIHPSSKIVQRNGSWAIRNMVSRSRDQCPTFLSCGIEDILKESMESFSDIQFDIKAALRDLGCEVELKEEWVGTKNKIHIEN